MQKIGSQCASALQDQSLKLFFIVVIIYQKYMLTYLQEKRKFLEWAISNTSCYHAW